MLIRRPVLDAIAAGTVTVLFRRWDRPRVRVGGTHRTAVGVLEVLAVDPVAASRLTAADARAAGFPTVAATASRRAHVGHHERARGTGAFPPLARPLLPIPHGPQSTRSRGGFA